MKGPVGLDACLTLTSGLFGPEQRENRLKINNIGMIDIDQE